MLLGFAGLTATNGSTSLLTKFVPGPPTVQSANGLRPETSVGPEAAGARPTMVSAAAATTIETIDRDNRIRPPLDACACPARMLDDDLILDCAVEAVARRARDGRQEASLPLVEHRGVRLLAPQA